MIDKIIKYLETEFPGIPIDDRGKYFVLPTICHNDDYSQASKKLYLYKNDDKDEVSPLFHCYTECSETFNIYQLIMRIESRKGKEITFKDAYRILHGKTFLSENNKTKEEKIVAIPKDFKNPLSIMLPEYPEGCLDMFYTNYMDPWALEGIDTPILEKNKISYSKSLEGVIIPHLDWRGRLIGIRIRSYNQLKENGFKYMPLFLSGTYYAHPLSLNLYGIYPNQKHIKKAKKCYLFEAEKSVLQYEQMFGEENISLAVCGKNISKWQLDILIYFLEVEELIVGFDKEYNTIEEMYGYINTIKEKLKYAMAFMRVGIMLDEKKAFRLKESPTDKTIHDFNGMKIYYLKGE